MKAASWFLTAGLAAFAFSARQLGAQTWALTRAPITNWTSVACSADGMTIAAASFAGPGNYPWLPGLIYLSTNSGASWRPASAPTTNWQSVAMSADATKMVAASYPGLVYASADSGLSWQQTPSPFAYWSSVASSGDGNRLVAGTFGQGSPPAFSGELYISTNSGTEWQRIPDQYGPYNGVAASADGTTFAALGFYPGPGVFGAADCFSTNWRGQIAHIYPQAIAPWTTVACSGNGSQIVAGAYDNGTWSSLDAGTSWLPTGPPWLQCSSLAMSVDGRKVVAAGGPNLSEPGLAGSIYTSTDFGSTWLSNSAPIATWACVASSADGCKLVAVVNGGGIYTWQATPVPLVHLSPSANSVLLAWIVPSMKFALQETADLNSGHWTGVAATPTLNQARLQLEVRLPLSNGSRFYRLLLTDTIVPPD